ncbi:MAG: tRNA (N6-isopentenyl adenosine(37)-C2)-methylthiotransferase MiaB [Coriobacteriales bacterium]|jgi:tRNA-2-methylthio-N6-dimethylallyladenosine synthase|nr:tRNA (N6-isopentenyl adenosine(37)-C2)-methylthiotransferase MiaB [Coriobacteriales bacterium]
MGYHLRTFGCQMNKHDSERVGGMLEALGAEPVAVAEDADIVVFMTCCVREAADVRLMGQVASLKNMPVAASEREREREHEHEREHGRERDKGTGFLSHPHARLRSHTRRIIAVGGCIGQRDGEKLVEQLPHIDVVFGTHNIGHLPALLHAALEGGGSAVEVLQSASGSATDLPTHREHAWHAWVPIMTGCNNFCSYCVVPLVRGREKSRVLEEVVAEAQRLVAEGVQEITLLGQNVNSYGRDLYGAPRFAEVLRAVGATGVKRLRFATSHPKDLSDATIAAFAEVDAVMPQLHLPVQHGSDSILRAMNRGYTAAHYLGLIEKLRAAAGDVALSTDIIVGFPGETETDFEATLELVRTVGYAQAFTFIYSKREGTPAAARVDDTPRELIQERFDRLVELVQASAWEQNQKEQGSVLPVLLEGASKRDVQVLTGRSPKNQTVHVALPAGASAEQLAGSFADVRIEEARTWYLRGVLL